MSNLPTRRGFLALTGTGAATSLAGCSQLDSITQNGSGNGGDALTVTVQPNQEKLTALQEEIRSSLENGTISQQEAQQRFREGQRKLTEEAAAAVQTMAESADGVSIEKSSPSYGFFLVDAPAETLVTALQSGDISAIYPADRYEEFAQQRDRLEQQRTAANEQQQSTETNESSSDGSPNESTGDRSTNESTGDGSTNESDA